MASRAAKPEASSITVTGSDFRPGIPAIRGETAIAARAYELWQQRGCPNGSDQEDWFRAERELQDRQGRVREAGEAAQAPV
jgi:hypothetical protein